MEVFCWYYITVVMLCISLLVLAVGSVQGDIIFSITSRALNPSNCIVDTEPLVKVTCTITPSATTSVALIKDSVTYSDCDNTQDDCFPEESVDIPRYFFTSDYTKSEFNFNIGNVTFGTDDGIYKCGTGGSSNSIEVDVCKSPTVVTITETETEPVLVSAETDCVYPDTDVTVEWFYVPTGSNDEYPLNVTFARDREVALCSHESRHVKSSFNHTDAVENKIEVLFRCKVTHSAVTNTIVRDTTRKYFIEEPECCCCCCCICCFIVLIVSVAVGILFTGGHIGLTWADHKYSIKKKRFENNDTKTTTETVCLKDYGIKAVLPECCICVVVIIVQIAVYFAALKKDCNEHCDDCNEHCDDCCGVFICLVITIIVSVVKDAAESGIIYLVVHVKGRNYIHQGGNVDKWDSACCRPNNSILPICAGDDQDLSNEIKPSHRPRGGDDRHQFDEPKSNTTNILRAQPPLPDIKSEKKKTRGLSANINDSYINPSYERMPRLTPIGQESQPGWEEKADRSEDGKEKKKKRKSKDKERDSNVTESADL